jgi:hypothetical protein
MQCECQTIEKKKKKGIVRNKQIKAIKSKLINSLLFDTSKPATPLLDSFALPSPLSTYISNDDVDFPTTTSISFAPTTQIYTTNGPQLNPLNVEDSFAQNTGNFSNTNTNTNTDTQHQTQGQR